MGLWNILYLNFDLNFKNILDLRFDCSKEDTVHKLFVLVYEGLKEDHLNRYKNTIFLIKFKEDFFFNSAGSSESNHRENCVTNVKYVISVLLVHNKINIIREYVNVNIRCIRYINVQFFEPI